MIEKRILENGRKQYRVQWRWWPRVEAAVKCFDRHEDAVRFETEIRRRKQLGELAVYEASKYASTSSRASGGSDTPRPSSPGRRRNATRRSGICTSCRGSAASSFGS